MNLPHVLLVEDDHDALKCAAELLEEDGFRVARAQDAGSAAMAMEESPAKPDLVVTDVHLSFPEGHGLSVAVAAAERDIPVLLITGDAAIAEELEAAGHSVLRKPFGSAVLLMRAKREIARPHDSRWLLRANLLELKRNRRKLQIWTERLGQRRATRTR